MSNKIIKIPSLLEVRNVIFASLAGKVALSIAICDVQVDLEPSP